MQSLQSRVGFTETDDKPQLPVPPDLMRSEFKTMTEVETAALPVSQLSVVVSSYDKTIGIHFISTCMNVYFNITQLIRDSPQFDMHILPPGEALTHILAIRVCAALMTPFFKT